MGVSKDRAERWRRILLGLGVFSILWNMGEAGAGLYFGVQHSQLALTAFAVQSVVEVISSVLVLLRLLSPAALQSSSPAVIARERIGTRVMGALFVLLALAVVAVGSYKLAEGQAPSSALSGFLVASASCFMMCVLWLLKRRGALLVQSSVLMQDAICSRTCMMLSLIVVIGSVVWMERSALVQLCGSHYCRFWWLDSTLAILYSLFVLRDGINAVRASLREDFAGGCGCCQSEKTPLLPSQEKLSVQHDGSDAAYGGRSAAAGTAAAVCDTGCCGDKAVHTAVVRRGCGGKKNRAAEASTDGCGGKKTAAEASTDSCCGGKKKVEGVSTGGGCGGKKKATATTASADSCCGDKKAAATTASADSCCGGKKVTGVSTHGGCGSKAAVAAEAPSDGCCGSNAPAVGASDSCGSNKAAATGDGCGSATPLAKAAPSGDSCCGSKKAFASDAPSDSCCGGKAAPSDGCGGKATPSDSCCGSQAAPSERCCGSGKAAPSNSCGSKAAPSDSCGAEASRGCCNQGDEPGEAEPEVHVDLSEA